MIKSGRAWLLVSVLVTVVSYAEQPGTWLPAGTISNEELSRIGVFALPNNRYLLIRVRNPGALCEIYDELTNSWSTTASASNARAASAAVRLSDGRVLICGGDVGGTIVASCEIFDATTGAWSAVASMNTARRFHSAIVLQDGRVLVIGGESGGGALSSCEIYDPNANSWQPTGALSTVRVYIAAVLLNDGRVLACSQSGGSAVTAEIFTPGSATWAGAGTLNVQRQTETMTLTVLPSGKALATGGFYNNSVTNVGKDCEVFDPVTLTWTPVSPLANGRFSHTAQLLNNGKVLVAGGVVQVGAGNPPINLVACELYDEVTNQWTAAEALPASSNSTAISTKTSTGKVLFVASNSVAYKFTLNDYPSITCAGSPTVLQPGENVAFASTASDPNGNTLSVLWDFKDGTTSNETNPVHAFTAAGTYPVTVTVSDGELTASATVTIAVVSGRPTPRFTTSDVVGFVGQPFTFDASLSTDPQNGIVAYSWNFGDGSEPGAGQVISKIYNATGTYTVTLTLTDNDGLVATVTRQIEILPADQLGVFNSQIGYKVKFDRNKQNADSLTVDAVVNVGDTEIAAGSAVAFEIVGQRFTGELDKKLRDFSNKNVKWQVKFGTRKQAAGEVALKLTVKKANLGFGFNQSGVVSDGDGEDVEANIPVKLEIAGRVFEVLIDSTFSFSKNGKKASGEGN